MKYLEVHNNIIYLTIFCMFIQYTQHNISFGLLEYIKSRIFQDIFDLVGAFGRLFFNFSYSFFYNGEKPEKTGNIYEITNGFLC